MLNISGPPSVIPPQRTEDSAFILKLNQRIVAEVMQVSGENVMLAVDGVRFVARLTSSDQAAALQERKIAQFIVKDINSNQVLIQLASPANQATAASFATQDLARALLAQLGIPDDASNLVLLRIILARGLPANLSTFNELDAVLNKTGAWGAPEAQVAASLKAAGLPLSPGTLALILNAPQETIQAYTHLLSLLNGLSSRQVSPQAAAALKQVLSALTDAAVVWTGNSSKMAENLRQVVALLGRTIESGLAKGLEEHTPNLLAVEQTRGLLNLLALRRELARSGPREVVEAIDRYLEALRFQNFQSSELEPAPGRTEWINLRLPLQLPPPPDSASGKPVYQEAKLRIACRQKGETREVSPDFTRFVITVDLANQATLEVDLSVVERKIGMQLTANSADLCNLAKEELPAFTRGLSELGFDLQTSRFEVGKPRDPLDLTTSEISPEKYLAVDLEV